MMALQTSLRGAQRLLRALTDIHLSHLVLAPGFWDHPVLLKPEKVTISISLEIRLALVIAVQDYLWPLI